MQVKLRQRARTIVALAFVALGACSGGEAAPGPSGSGAAPGAPASTPSPAAQAEATQIFGTRCAACHGPEGRGDGPASAGLTPKPANFTDVAWQGGVNDAHIEQIIQYGGAAVGKSPAMPSNPDLTGKPEVVAALRVHLRELAH